MKKFYLLSLVAALLFGACHKSDDVYPTDSRKECREATERFEKLIATVGGYDVLNIEVLLSEYWALDAVCCYDSNYTKVTDILRPFDLPFWKRDFAPVFSFYLDGDAKRYTLDGDGKMISQKGKWSYDETTALLSYHFDEWGGIEHIYMKATIKALSTNNLVLEWNDSYGRFYRASYIAVDYLVMQEIALNTTLERTLDKSANFDAASVTDAILGLWSMDTYILYNDDWSSIKQPYIAFGVEYVTDFSSILFDFKEGGELVEVVSNPLSDDGRKITTHQWSYNRESKSILVVSASGEEQEYKIKGIGDDYLLMDYRSESGEYIRVGFNRDDPYGGMVWDIVFPTASYAVFDSEGNNIFANDAEALYDFTISYNDKEYKYEEVTRALPQEPLALYTDYCYPYRICFGDFDHNEKGSYTINFRGKEWLVEFEYTLDWYYGEPVLGSTLKIDGEEAEMVVVGKKNRENYGEINIWAFPLYL